MYDVPDTDGVAGGVQGALQVRVSHIQHQAEAAEKGARGGGDVSAAEGRVGAGPHPRRSESLQLLRRHLQLLQSIFEAH